MYANYSDITNYALCTNYKCRKTPSLRDSHGGVDNTQDPSIRLNRKPQDHRPREKPP